MTFVELRSATQIPITAFPSLFPRVLSLPLSPPSTLSTPPSPLPNSVPPSPPPQKPAPQLLALATTCHLGLRTSLLRGILHEQLPLPSTQDSACSKFLFSWLSATPTLHPPTVEPTLQSPWPRILSINCDRSQWCSWKAPLCCPFEYHFQTGDLCLEDARAYKLKSYYNSRAHPWSRWGIRTCTVPSGSP